MPGATFSSVKLQLTKSKSVEIALPALLGGKSGGDRTSGRKDLTGVELFGRAVRGWPAVRLYRKKGAWHLGAAGYVQPVDGELPVQWEDVSKQPTWSLPRDFQAPDAALAANTTMGVFGQSSPEAILLEMANGIGPADTAAAAPAAEKKRFGLKRTTTAPAPKTTEVAKPQRHFTLPVEGVPTSENGRRFVVKPVAEEGFYMSASMPEFQALWLSRLLPEGHRPTAVSVQLADAALMASVLAQPEYLERRGTLLAVFVRESTVYFAGYKNGMPVLWRRCPGARGYGGMREAVKKALGVDDELVMAALEDSVIDPRPALEPVLHPIFDQLELARAFLAGKHGIDSDRILLCGLPYGAEHWVRYAEEALRVQLVPADPFAGLIIDKGVDVTSPHDFLVALGAALAASEAES